MPDGRVKCHYGLSCPSCRETERGDVVEVELDEPAWQQEKTIFETRRHEWKQSRREGGRGRQRTEGARGVCGGMVLFGRLVDNTSPTSSPCNSSSPPLPLLPHHPIRSMATDKQAGIFDETGTLTLGLTGDLRKKSACAHYRHVHTLEFLTPAGFSSTRTPLSFSHKLAASFL